MSKELDTFKWKYLDWQVFFDEENSKIDEDSAKLQLKIGIQEIILEIKYKIEQARSNWDNPRDYETNVITNFSFERIESISELTQKEQRELQYFIIRNILNVPKFNKYISWNDN